MNRLAKLSAYYMGNRGFSIGIEDVTPSVALREFKEELIQEGFEKADKNIDQVSARVGLGRVWSQRTTQPPLSHTHQHPTTPPPLSSLPLVQRGHP